MGFVKTAALASALLGAANASPHYAPPSNETIHYTTEVVTHLTTYCPAATTLTYGDKTYTVTKATTLTIEDCSCTITKPVATATGYAPPKPTHTGDCAEMCSDKFDACRVAPDANMAECAAKYAECLGFNPWESGKFVEPTACHEGAKPTKPVKPVYTTEVVTKLTTYCPEKTTLTYGNQTIPVTKPGTVTVTGIHHTTTSCVPPTGYAPPTTPSTPAEAKDCAEMCTDKYDSCRSASGSNKATCAAEYSECLGYAPFDSNGSLVKPTACHGPSAPPAGPTGTSPKPSGAQPPAPVVPSGTGAGAPPATPTAVTAGAAQVVPAGIMAVVGAFALL
ncbi:uncharacterized protein FIESC28_03790 [Fusarium coffeatum]|uniref:Cell wall glycoprotein n=1 Tax=Fusarium coffeatum TaxID=231269 RepID=A0A366S277_9HYPO|nr:uncharacterized protein FIESC28_03790 [Fusarium coffeatum]RBR23411.1 hypothetical protein FIESC28_03790 [Fusarium coffeatum]